jgi:hypothetical protein
MFLWDFSWEFSTGFNGILNGDLYSWDELMGFVFRLHGT